MSYSDFITLLFAFFVVMYSVSHVSETKYKQLSSTLSQAFDGAHFSYSDKTLEKAADEKTAQEQQYQQASAENNLADLTELQEELEGALLGLVQKSQVQLSGNEDWVEIDINANMIFESAKAELSTEAKVIFTDIADVLSPYENAVEVSGHTDDIPISNSNFANNWELSSARAVSVVSWLAYNGVKPERLAAVGYGEYQPVADNTTEEGRASNRRVVLRVARDRAEQPRQKVEDVFTGAQVTPQDASVPVENDSAASSEQAIQQAAVEPGELEQNDGEAAPAITPIELENGGLLFTNDPDSPRNKDR